MGILNGLALALLALAIPIIILYMLRLRRREVIVSSRMLWTRILQDKQANVPWQRLQRNLLMFLQLGLLALLVFALARPFVEVATAARGNIVVLLDASASMQATDVPPNRFAVAQQKVSDLIDSLGASDKMTIISVAASNRTLITASDDKAALHAALSSTSVTNGSTNMADGLRLAASVASQAQDSAIVVVSDGAVGDLSTLPPLTASVRYIPIGGGSDNNQAITALAVRDGPNGPQALVGLANFGSVAATGILTVSVDGQLWSSQQVGLGAGQHSSVVVNDLPRTTQIVNAHFSSKDSLVADDTAAALRSNAQPSKALLISDGNLFIEKAMALLPNIQLDKVKPADFTSSAGYDLVIYDGPRPVMPAAINTSLLVFNPAPFLKPNGQVGTGDPNDPATDAFNVTGRLEYPQIGAVQVNDPIMRYVNLNAVQISTARKMTLPTWAHPLALDRDGNPLIFAGSQDGRRIAVFAFDLHNSTLPLLVAYPLLMSNVVNYLTSSQTVAADLPASLKPGEAIITPAQTDATRVSLTRPDGQQVDLPMGGGVISYGDTQLTGIYSVQQFSPSGALGQPSRFAVDLFDPQESRIAAQPSLNIAGQQAGGANAATSEREFWPLIVVVALLLAVVEWWIYFRGRRLPRFGRPSATS